MEGLQWLAGYVVKKLRSKSKKKLHHWYDILGQMIAENDDGQPLIAMKNRGALTALTNQAQKIFHNAESLYRLRISASMADHHINTQKMVPHLVL